MSTLKKAALRYHSRGRPGKIEVTTTKPLVSQRDLSLAYSPGVAEPCLEIAENADAAWDYTARGNLVAVITNGTAVLGLGDIGALAGKPVMEGKAGLFKKFADIDVFDIELAETDVDRFVDIVAAMEPTFGGINLEDIKAPECFEIEEKLRERLSIPVFHDDQHGTAIISGAALINACKLTGRKLEEVKVVVSGAGASAIACVDFFCSLGVRPESITLCDSRGVVYQGRENVNSHKARYAQPDTGRRTLADALVGADMLLGLSIGGVVSKEMVKTMAGQPIIFALANPDPEISYPDALEAREDAIVATGRSDYPNQVNNVLGFPYIFRGALDVRATGITEPMKVAAAHALARLTHESVHESVISAYGGKLFKFGPEYLIPKPFDPRVLWWVAPAVAEAAVDSGVARKALDIDAYREGLAARGRDADYTIMYRIEKAAKADPKRIVFPEANSERVLRAIQVVVDSGIAHPVLLGRRDEIAATCERLELNVIDRCEVVDPRTSESAESYALRLAELRQRKGMTRGLARSLMVKSNYYGCMMLSQGEADGLVAGFKQPYPETLRPALQIFGLRPGVTVATGMYMMTLKDRVAFFADATINIDPDEEALADIAVQVTDAVKALGITPRAAMISFSNFGSVKHPDVARVRRALERVRQARPELEIDGEMQADLALNPEVRQHIYPFCQLTGAANTLIFASLEAGNAAYKVLEHLGGARPVGPMILGLGKPVTVLQPTSTVRDIVNMTAYTVLVAQHRARSS
jgi:malate dehydrogenase (oxaloacetate-decarboxylating)(NADP+)